jgi:hypothetical protein
MYKIGKKGSKMLILLAVSVAFAEYSVLAEYTAETFGRNHLRSDTNAYVKSYAVITLWNASNE